jgi:predicted transcriptional regulator
VVVNEQRIVLGLLKPEALNTDPASIVEQVMEPAPATIRPYLSVRKAIESMDQHKLDRILVTTSDGKLVGILQKNEAAKHLS